MQASEVSGGTVRRVFGKCPKIAGHLAGHPTGHVAKNASENNEMQVSGALSGAVRPVSLSAVCPVGVSLGHPTPDTRTPEQPEATTTPTGDLMP